jgi:hypothetical protein
VAAGLQLQLHLQRAKALADHRRDGQRRVGDLLAHAPRQVRDPRQDRQPVEAEQLLLLAEAARAHEVDREGDEGAEGEAADEGEHEDDGRRDAARRVGRRGDLRDRDRRVALADVLQLALAVGERDRAGRARRQA